MGYKSLVPTGEDLVPSIKKAIRYMARGKTPRQAAVLAKINVTDAWYKFLDTDRFKAELNKEGVHILQVELVPLAIETLRLCMESKDVPWRTRIDAANSVLNRGGMPAMPYREADGTGSPESMSHAELTAFIQQAQDQLAERAKLVNATEGNVIEGEAIEIID